MEYTDKATLANILNKITDPLDLSMVRNMLEGREQDIAKQETVDNLKKALQDYFDAGFEFVTYNIKLGYGGYECDKINPFRGFDTLEEFYHLLKPNGDWSEYEDGDE